MELSFLKAFFPHHVETLKNIYADLNEDELKILIETLKKVGYKAKEFQGGK